MDREEALAALQEVYGEALTLRDQGLDDTGVAQRLGVPPESIPAMLHLAEQKLARLTAHDPPEAIKPDPIEEQH